MPNLEQTKKAEARRKAREAKQEASAKQARADLERLPSDTAKARIAAVDKPDDTKPDPNADNQAKIATDTPGVRTDTPAGRTTGGDAPLSAKAKKAATKRMTQMAAEQQAKRDALRSPEPAPDNYRPGDTIPLHILNQRSKRERAEARDEAVEIAREIGLYSRDRIEGRAPRSIPDRSKRMRDAMAARDKVIAEAKAKKD